MKLIEPSIEYQKSYEAYIKELGEEERYPFTLDLPHQDFELLLRTLSNYQAGVDLPAGSVPNTTLWLVNDYDIIGVTNIRHYLNERIEYCGAHIGLGIRPKYRGQGLGNKLMSLSIDYLKGLKITPIHIHCYKDNIASAKTIAQNGGTLRSEIELGDQTVQRYIII